MDLHRWPADEDLPRTTKVRARLAGLPDVIAGISLRVLKATTLPAIKDDNAPAADGPFPGDATTTEDGLLEQLQALAREGLAAPGTLEPPGDDKRIRRALLGARAFRARGDADRAVRLLRAAARVARLWPAWTYFALWLLEVAERWMDGGTCKRLRCGVLGELGSLVAQAGDVRDGTQLIRNGSECLFAFADQAPERDEVLRAAWQLKYQAAEWGLRSHATRRAAVAELKAIHDTREAPDGSEAWFNAGFELIAGEARPSSQAADVLKAQQLLRQLDRTKPAAADRLRAHGHRVLGYTLAFGNNSFLHTRSRDEFQAAADLFRAGRDWSNLAQTLDALGRIRAQLGEHAGADEALRESTELKQHFKDVWGLGASLNARAESLLRRGRGLDAVPFYDANLALIRQIPDTPRRVVLQNLGQKATAYLAAYPNPLDAGGARPAADDLEKAAAALDEYARLMAGQPDMQISSAYHLMLRGALARLQARGSDDKQERLQVLARGAGWLRRSIAEFQDVGHREPLPNAEIYLAGLLIDQARLPEADAARDALLDGAREELEKAGAHVWDTYERAYLEVEWAWYYQTAGQLARAENHIASARHHANACGNESIQVRAEASMGVHLRGPTDKDRWDVVLPPGARLDIPVFARDWRGRPLAGYRLHATLRPGPGSDGLPVRLEADARVTNAVGQASFTVAAAADARPGTAVLEVSDHDVLRVARVEVHVQPFDVELGPGLPEELRPHGEDELVLRHLFGPRFRRLVIRKQFSGLGGARVILVEPFLVSPSGLESTAQPADAGLRGQLCLVKIGDRRDIVGEADCYDRHVRDLLSPNVSRFAGRTAWLTRAGIRMSLAGDQDWDRALEEREWLLGAPLMDTHHLLDDMFAGDLGTCWYNNGPVPAEKKLFEVYGRQLPILLTLREPGLAGGLLRDGEAVDLNPTALTEGLRPAAGQRGLKKGKKVYLGELVITGWARHGDGEWEYRLVSPPDGLRVAFRTQVPPEFLDPDGVPDNLVGQRRHVLGVVEEFAFSHLSAVLQACVEHYSRDLPDGEKVRLTPGGASLSVPAASAPEALPNPLVHLHDFLHLPLPHKRSIIHGDLHTRNVIVSPRGVPYYIDFSETDIGPTLFDFVKHEVALWDWTLASPPAAPLQCTLAEAVRLMEDLTRPKNRFPVPFALPAYLREDTGGGARPRAWLAKFYHCVGTLRSLARQHSAYPVEAEAPDYFTPLCLYAALVLRWCDPRGDVSPEEKASRARRGVFVTVLAGLLLRQGLFGVTVPH
jgi:hypothetical protein